MSYTNKVVLITGAGSGIGEAIAIRFAKLSARLSLLDINLDNLNKVVQQCEVLSQVNVLKLVVDVTKDEELKQAVEDTIKEYGKINVLVNSAGVFSSDGILNTDVMSVFDRVVNVNLRSMVAMTHYTAAALIETKGCVINIASVMSRSVRKGYIGYNVSKAGIVHFTKNVALELADKGVRVNSVSPGPVNTNILLHAGYVPDEIEKIYEQSVKTLPLQYQPKVNEIADMVEYLASDKANSITGADFIIDSGYLLTQTHVGLVKD